MNAATPLPLAERFSRVIHLVLHGLGSRYRADSILGPALAIALISLVHMRLNNLRRRFLALLERIQAGTLRKLPEPGQGRRRKPSARKLRPNLLAQYGVKDRWGWVVNIACRNGDELQALLEDPEMQAMIAAEPRRMGRILRPVCRMLGVSEIPDLLRLPSQADVVTVDWAAHAKMVAAEKAATAAGLPPPVWPQPPRAARRSKHPFPPFRFYITSHGPPLRA